MGGPDTRLTGPEGTEQHQVPAGAEGAGPAGSHPQLYHSRNIPDFFCLCSAGADTDF